MALTQEFTVGYWRLDLGFNLPTLVGYGMGMGGWLHLPKRRFSGDWSRGKAYFMK